MFYSVAFMAARSCAQAEKLNVSVDPEFGLLPIQTVYTSTGWDTYSWAFKPRHSTVWLSIHNTGIEENPRAALSSSPSPLRPSNLPIIIILVVCTIIIFGMSERNYWRSICDQLRNLRLVIAHCNLD